MAGGVASQWLQRISEAALDEFLGDESPPLGGLQEWELELLGDGPLRGFKTAKKHHGGEGRTPRRRIERRRRVNCHLLREQIPDADELEMTLAAEAAVALSATQRPETFWYPEFDDRDLEQGQVADLDSKSSTAWKLLQKRVAKAQEETILTELGPGAKLSPIFPSKSVSKAFFEVCRKHDHKISIGYHGTKQRNIGSISKVGLLVPGQESGVKVANGSAHGVGVYTAQLGSASLSRTFCDSGKIFICAICDTSQPITPQEVEANKWVASSTYVMTVFPNTSGGNKPTTRRGNYNVTRESEEVRHVGSAMVIFDDRFVVPLFLGTVPPPPDAPEDPQAIVDPKPQPPPEPAPLPRRCWEAPQKVGRRRIAAPEEGRSCVLFPQHGERAVGETVWLTPKPLGRVSAHARTVKRRQVRKERDSMMRHSRESKLFRNDREVYSPEEYNTGPEEYNTGKLGAIPVTSWCSCEWCNP